ncbi:Aquaporin-11 like protein [Argiope bruennichi]|uniref:Aquaporin-11 like protein n=1 Tax=Argiope bruennichi TaxID=94029 RepID=A0A8T0F9A0_ARGBR|nr:Aquaporin-11 like protein [Argiope bruennichi]
MCTVLVLFLNTAVFHILRKGLLRNSQRFSKFLVADSKRVLNDSRERDDTTSLRRRNNSEKRLVKERTKFSFCVCFEIHGYLGLGIPLLALCFWWCSVWGDAEACPCGPFEECLFGNGLDAEVGKKLLGQAVGGAVTSLWINYIWSFHMNEEHEALHTAAECQAGLQVHMAIGALIEGLITLISRVVALESVNWNPEISLSTNAIVTTVLVLAATSTTGGFFNPVLATALTLGCRGNTVVEHIVVYWIGSLVGGFIGRYLYHLRHGYEKLKEV